MLAARLYISRLTVASLLPSEYDEQRHSYASPDSLVPDPSTIRPCTPEEAEQYIHPFGSSRRTQTDVVMYIGEAVDEAQKLFKDGTPVWFGRTRSGTGELTTTLQNPKEAVPKKEGMHVDDGEEYAHRLGVCLDGNRQIVVGTHSARRILGTEHDLPSSSALRRRFQNNPELFGSVACLHVSFEGGEAYDAWTGELLHDGSSLQIRKDGASSSVTEIIFARL